MYRKPGKLGQKIQACVGAATNVQRIGILYQHRPVYSHFTSQISYTLCTYEYIWIDGLGKSENLNTHS